MHHIELLYLYAKLPSTKIIFQSVQYDIIRRTRNILGSIEDSSISLQGMKIDKFKYKEFTPENCLEILNNEAEVFTLE